MLLYSHMTDVQRIPSEDESGKVVATNAFRELPIVIAAFYARGSIKATDVQILTMSETYIKLRIHSLSGTHKWVRGGPWGWKQN